MNIQEMIELGIILSIILGVMTTVQAFIEKFLGLEKYEAYALFALLFFTMLYILTKLPK